MELAGPTFARNPGLLSRGLPLLGLMVVTLWAVRWRTGWQIRRSPGPAHIVSPTNRFSLKFLLAWMTICGLRPSSLGAVLILQELGNTEAFVDALDGHLVASDLSDTLAGAMRHRLSFCRRGPVARVLLLLPLLWVALFLLTVEAMLAAAARFGMMPNDREGITSFVIWAQAGAVSGGELSASALVAASRWISIISPAEV